MFLVSFSSATNERIDTGNGYIYKLDATQDVFIYDNSNHNKSNFLIVGKHTDFPKKRMLLQFQDIPKSCEEIEWAKMYIRYWFSYKDSSMTVKEVPFIVRTLQVHQIKQEWNEAQATSVYRKSDEKWTSSFLALNGRDASSRVEDSVNIFTSRPNGQYIEFDITEVSRKWKSGEDNYGVLVLATNEKQDGRDIRFYSRERDTGKPFVNVLCKY